MELLAETARPTAPIMVLAPEVVEKAGKFATADVVVGTGALQSRTDQVGTELMRNPDYWKPGLPWPRERSRRWTSVSTSSK